MIEGECEDLCNKIVLILRLQPEGPKTWKPSIVLAKRNNIFCRWLMLDTHGYSTENNASCSENPPCICGKKKGTFARARTIHQGLVNVLIEHHPIIWNIISNRYLKVMFKIPKKGHLPTPVHPSGGLRLARQTIPIRQSIVKTEMKHTSSHHARCQFFQKYWLLSHSPARL